MLVRAESLEGYKICYPDDLVVNIMLAWNRGLAFSSIEGIVSPAYCVYTVVSQDSPRFLNYLVRDDRSILYYKAFSSGVIDSRLRIYPDVFGSLFVALPDREEQDQIASFLDTEVAKIDALTEEQQRLIDLLKEKRQTVISHAVTKGIRRNAEMVQSGRIELGEVPKDWKVTPLGYFSRLHRGHDLTSDQQKEGPYPVVTSGGITGLHAAYIAKAPGVVTGRYGSTGRLFYIEEDYWPHNTSLYVSDFFGNVPKYVWYSLQSVNFESHSAKSAVPGIDRNDLHVLPVAVPPCDEQLAIVRHLDNRTEAFDALSGEAVRARELLQERRNALISAAVTGKIDVRAYAAKPVPSAMRYSSGFAHQLLAAEILDRSNDPSMGRIKLQKLIHLCEYHGQIDEVQGDYARKAAGPLDAKAMAGIGKNLKKQQWFEEVHEDNRYLYRPLEKRGGHKKYLARWESAMPRVTTVLDLLGNAKTRQCEIVSTLYAAWNDLILDKAAVSDAAILHEASSAERWHKNKEKIAPEAWQKALRWMREKDLVPVGYGKHTSHNSERAEASS